MSGMKQLPALGCALLAARVLAMSCASDGGSAPEPEVKRGPKVDEAQHSDTSPPLRDIPPAKEQPGHRVHEVKPIPRPKPQPPPEDGGSRDP